MSRCRFIPLILLLVVLTACQPALPELPAETFTPSASATPVFTPTASPTIEPTVTITPTPTATPVTLPVTNGTPIPDLPYEVITAENISRLHQVARYGYPRLLESNPYRLTADGKTLVVATTLGLDFYDAATQEKTGGFEVEFRSFDMTYDGEYLLTFDGGALTMWTRNGEMVREFDLPVGDSWYWYWYWYLNPMALSPDGTLLAVQHSKIDWMDEDTVDVYRVADGSLLDTVRGTGVMFSPDGQFLATVFDGSVRLYPVPELGQGWKTRLPKQTLPWCGASEDGSCGLAFSPNGTLAAVLRPSRVDVYLVSERRLVRQVIGWEADKYTLPQVQFSADSGRMLVTTPALYDRFGNVRVKPQAIAVDVATGEWVGKSDVEDGFAYLRDGQVRMFPWDVLNTARLLGIKNDGQLVLESETCQVVDSNLTCYWLSKDGKEWQLMNEYGETVLRFNSLGENRVGVWVFPGYFVVNHVFGVGAFETGSIHIYDTTGNATVKIKGVVAFATVVPSGKFGLLTTDDTFIVVERGQKPKFFQVSKTLMGGMGDSVLVTLNYGRAENKFTFWSAEDKLSKMGEWSADFYTPVDGGSWVSLSPDGRLFLFSTGTAQNGVGVIPLQSDPTLTYLLWDAGVVKRLSFSPDGRLLATYGDDNFIRVWAVMPEQTP